MKRHEDRVAIITGATSGIGRACAVAFAEEGARVVVSGRRREVGAALASSLGNGAIFVATDVSREGDIKALVDTTLERFGRIDCVISNAGSTSTTGPIADTDPKAFDHDLAMHVRAAFLAIKFASPSMVKRRSGSFINMSSISGLTAGWNVFGYEVAKAALAHLTRCAALELGEHGIRVNCISPGPTRTGIFAKAGGMDADAADQATDALEAAFALLLPEFQAMPGMIQAEDIANAAVFLASDEARYVTGQDLAIDGGITAGKPAMKMRADWQALGEGIQNYGKK